MAATLGIAHSNWRIIWTIVIVTLVVVGWWVIVKPALESRFLRTLKKYSTKKRASKKATLPIKLALNFSTVFVFAGVALLLVFMFNLQGNRFVTGGGLLAGSGILAIALFQSKFGGGFLSGIEVLLLGAFDEGDWIKWKNQFGEITAGRVEDVGTHSTLMMGFNLNHFYSVNHEITRATSIENLTRSTFRYIQIPVELPAASLVKKADDLVSALGRKTTSLMNDGQAQRWYQNLFLPADKLVTGPQWQEIIMPSIDYMSVPDDGLCVRVAVTSPEEEWNVRKQAWEFLTVGRILPEVSREPAAAELPAPAPIVVKQPIPRPPPVQPQIPPATPRPNTTT